VTPWWLRPTAESEKKKSDDRKDDTEPAREKGAPAPQPAEAPRDDRAPNRGGGGRSEGRGQSRGEGQGEGKGAGRSEAKGGDEPEKDRRPGGSDGKDSKDGRRRSGRSRRSDEPKDNGADKKSQKDQPSQKDQKTTDRSSSGTRSKPKPRPKDEPSDAPKEPKHEAPKKERQGRERKPDRGPAPHDITAEDIAEINRELFHTPGGDGDHVPERISSVNDERKIAMFCDLENIALGVRDSDIKKFDINLVLERLLEKGKIIVKRAYCDWERYSEYKRAFHEAAIEMLDIPQKYYSGKNSADIKMVVDALDLCYTKEHLDTFVLLSGDSDFSPLVSKLKENDKYVIGIGVKNSSSALLVDNCDEFIFYEDIWRDRQAAPELAGLNKKASEAFSLMIDAIQALIRENKEVLWGSMIKQTMQRKRPSFNEGYYGYGSFSELLEDAEKKSILKLKKDQRSGTYIVTGFAKH